jgi:phosphopantothenoylcysteine synthetase/decarboxylase
MTDYKKMNCEDMKLFIFEWAILNPEAGKGIKYVRNLNKQDLTKVCLYIEGKLSRDEMMEVIIAKQEYFRQLAKNRKMGSSNSLSSESSESSESSDSEEDDDTDTETDESSDSDEDSSDEDSSDEDSSDEDSSDEDSDTD